MSDVTPVVTREGTHTHLEAAALAQFATALQGQLLRAGDDGYDEARTVWNGMVDRRPGLIARCTSQADVRAAVAFASRHALLVSVKGGGHNVAGHAVCDGGLLIDLSPMQDVAVDAATRTVTVQPGVLWSTVDRATQAHGLATTGGTVSHTGVAGLTLGGGLGWLMSRHGLACDNLLGVDVVLADGTAVRASETDHPDLFWAVRGGGGNFGIVTSFQFQLHEVGPTVVGGLRLYPYEQARDVLEFYRTFSAQAPDDLTVFAAVLTLPNGPKVLGLAVAWFGEVEAADAILAPLRAFGSPIADTIGPMPYLQLQQMFDAMVPHGISRYWKSGYVEALDDALLDVLVTRGAELSPLSSLLLFHMHGACSRTAPEATAFGARRHQWDVDILTQWVDRNEAAQHIAWTRTFWEAVAPFSVGVYVNHLDGDEQSRVRSAFGHNHAKLATLKHRYDPDNVFRHNSNILPSA